MPDFPCAIIPRERGGAVLARRDGLYLMDLATGAIKPFSDPRPTGRATGRTRPSATSRLWLGTMQDNLEADGSPKAMTDNTGALYKVLADGTWTREVDGVGLSNTLAWKPTAGFSTTATRSPTSSRSSTAIRRRGASAGRDR